MTGESPEPGGREKLEPALLALLSLIGGALAATGAAELIGVPLALAALAAALKQSLDVDETTPDFPQPHASLRWFEDLGRFTVQIVVWALPQVPYVAPLLTFVAVTWPLAQSSASLDFQKEASNVLALLLIGYAIEAGALRWRQRPTNWVLNFLTVLILVGGQTFALADLATATPDHADIIAGSMAAGIVALLVAAVIGSTTPGSEGGRSASPVRKRRGSIGRDRPGARGMFQSDASFNEKQQEEADRLLADSRLRDLGLIRLVWGDQHGLTRAKAVTVEEFGHVLRRGRPFQLAPMLLDTAGNPVISPFSENASFGIAELEGLPDGVLVPDSRTFQVMPWNSATGLVICDLRLPSGAPLPFCTRQLLWQQLEKLAVSGLEYRVGLEIELYVMQMVDERLDWPASSQRPPAAPIVAPLGHGEVYHGEQAFDPMDAVVKLVRETAEGLELPLATVEMETGPGHLECTFDPLDAATAADAMLLFRSGVKQAARRAGYHASFMPRPQLDAIDPSGWHLHQSLARKGHNLFAGPGEPYGLSAEARSFLGGLLAHANESSLLVAPLVNSYKRYEPGSFAPSTACWTRETRGSLVRVLGGGDEDRTRLEFRGGDSAANPYLYIASQLIAGLNGMEQGLDAGPPDADPRDSQAPSLPKSLMEAIEAFGGSTLYRKALGDAFVDYLITIKRHEAERFLSAVTDWEQREYFRSF
jgi:glutamine synthetase